MIVCAVEYIYNQQCILLNYNDLSEKGQIYKILLRS